MGRPGALLLALTLGAGGCRAGWLQQLFTERPPAPLDEVVIASDARLDSTGAVGGSFVGEGTWRRIHLLSSDTSLVAALVRRYRPARDSQVEPWLWLAKRKTFTVNLDPARDAGLARQRILVSSPDGHTAVTLRTILLQGSTCGPRGSRAEFLVEPTRSGEVDLRGPVVGAFFLPGDRLVPRPEVRQRPAPPDDDLSDSLVAWTRQAMDSSLGRRLARRDLPLSGPVRGRPELNGLSDEDAADVLAFRLEGDRIRFAVSLRERRRTARGEPVLVATVMVWDAGGQWRQTVFHPTILEYRRGRPGRSLLPRRPPVFWRRLEAVSGFVFRRDYLWMEQVDAEDGTVLWVILEPRSNTVVAAAEVTDPC